jgi:ABC-type branched-subunit amino acid transport system substrate-binding protein
VNSTGGVLGKPLNIRFEDTGAAMATILDAKKLAEGYDIPLVLGGYSSGVSSEAVSYMKLRKIFQIPLGSTYPFFNMMDLGEVIGNQLGKFALEDSGAERVAIMAIDNSIGMEIEKSIRKVVEQASGKVVSEIRYKASEKEYVEKLRLLFQSRPQIVFLVPIGIDARLILEQASMIGFKEKVGWYCPYIDLWASYLIPETSEQIKGLKIGVYEPLYTKYTYIYEKMFKEKPQTVLSTYAYDATKLAALVLNQAKSTKYDDLALTWFRVSNSYQGVTGLKKFDKEGRQIPEEYKMVIYDKGRLVSYSPCPVPPFCKKQIKY